jgi:putative copper resistance protein D
MLETGLILCRFVHYVSVLALFGAALFPHYARCAPDGLGRVLSLSVLAAFLSGIGWFLFTAGIMAGSADAVFSMSVWRGMITSMDFGWLWIARLGLVLSVGIALARFRSAIPFLSFILLITLAGTGHAQASAGAAHWVHIVADGLHLVAAGAWLGGLWPLGMMLASGALADEQTGALLMRFSGMGMLAVAVLVMSGLLNSWFLVGSLGVLVATPYGQILIAKLAVFTCMLMLAGANRYWITPHFMAVSPGALWLRRLRRHVVAEQALGVAVLALVSVLGTISPALAS